MQNQVTTKAPVAVPAPTDKTDSLKWKRLHTRVIVREPDSPLNIIFRNLSSRSSHSCRCRALANDNQGCSGKVARSIQVKNVSMRQQGM